MSSDDHGRLVAWLVSRVEQAGAHVLARRYVKSLSPTARDRWATYAVENEIESRARSEARLTEARARLNTPSRRRLPDFVLNHWPTGDATPEYFLANPAEVLDCNRRQQREWKWYVLDWHGDAVWREWRERAYALARKEDADYLAGLVANEIPTRDSVYVRARSNFGYNDPYSNEDTEDDSPATWHEWSRAVGERMRFLREEVERRAGRITLDTSDEKFLATEFALGDGSRASWGTATVDQHEKRLAMLVEMADGTLETAATHKAAINLLRTSHATNLGAIPTRAAS